MVKTSFSDTNILNIFSGGSLLPGHTVGTTNITDFFQESQCAQTPGESADSVQLKSIGSRRWKKPANPLRHRVANCLL